MAKKRKSVQSSAPRKKQQQQEPEPVEVPQPQPQPEAEKEDVVEQVEEEEFEENEEEEEEEHEEEEKEEDEEEEGDDNEAPGNETVTTTSTSSAAAAISGAGQNGGEVEDDDEPILKLLEPFSKDQLIDLLCGASEKHVDIADRIRKVADEDPSHRKIFVHGLGWDTNADTLISVFKQFGEVEDCKAVCDKVSGKSKGYGFILFKKRSGARKALKEPQKKIGSRMTACQLASIGPVPPPNAAPAAQAPPVSETTLRKIYISNVGADLDPQKLLSFFSQFGEIEEGPLGLDKVTGKPKGFCLFVYKTAESARKALEEPHKNFEGHILHCQKAIDGPKIGKSQHPHQHQHQLQHQNQHQHQHQHQHQSHHHSHNSQFQRNKNPSYSGGTQPAPNHLMAPAGAGIGFNQGPAAAQALNPALGQALTALLASQGAGLGLTNLLGTLGSAGSVNPAVPGGAAGMPVGYGSQTNMAPGGVMGGYGSQGAIQGGYPSQQIGQGGSGRGQHGVGQYGGPSYMGH